MPARQRPDAPGGRDPGRDPRAGAGPPALAEGASRDAVPHRAGADAQRALGFPGELREDWHDAAIARLGELVRERRGLRMFLDACVDCGACTDKCHYFLGTGDPRNMPVARQDLLRRVYRRHFTLAGRLFPRLVGAADLDKALLEQWYAYFHQCSQCRRCAVACPFGIDTAEITMAARDVLAHVGIGQRYAAEVLGKAHRVGNNLGLPAPALADALAGLEEDVEEATGVPVRFPLDAPGAEVLLVTPSADFFAEPQVDGLIGYAKVFHQAGLSWTLSSHASEASNFGLFLGREDAMRPLAERVREAARELGVRRIVFGECGHAWRVACNWLEALAGPLDFLDPRYPVPQHVVEVTHDLLARGALALEPTANDHRRVTFHDSCNVARGSGLGGVPGGQFRLPREVLRACCNHFHDMAPGTVGVDTFCCGAGGGLLTDELMDLRVAGAAPRMRALEAVIERHGVTHLAAMCAICKSQLAAVFPRFGLERDRVVSLHQLVGDAVVLGAKA